MGLSERGAKLILTPGGAGPGGGLPRYSGMPHYFFHVFNSHGDACDEEGRDLPGTAAARKEAIDGIRSILGEELKTGVIDLTGRVEVKDGEGNILDTVPFIQAVELRGLPS